MAGEWDLPFVPGLSLNSRIVYTGTQYIDTLPSRRTLPEWTRFDLGARYAFDNPGAKGKLLVARFNVDNVLDNSHWAGDTNTLPYIGAPRTFSLSLSANFRGVLATERQCGIRIGPDCRCLEKTRIPEKFGALDRLI